MRVDRWFKSQFKKEKLSISMILLLKIDHTRKKEGRDLLNLVILVPNLL